MTRYRSSNPNTIRTITAKFAGQCNCCGGTIKAGDFCDYWPAKRAIAHHKGWDGNSTTCYSEQMKRQRDPGFVDIDRRYEDQCADICGR